MNRFVRLVPKFPNVCISDSRNTFIYSEPRGFPLREDVKERDNVALVGASLSSGWISVPPPCSTTGVMFAFHRNMTQHRCIVSETHIVYVESHVAVNPCRIGAMLVPAGFRSNLCRTTAVFSKISHS